MKKLLFMLMGVAATINAMAVDYTAKATILLEATSGESCEMYLYQSDSYGALSGYEMYMPGRKVALYPLNGNVQLQTAKAADLDGTKVGFMSDASTSYTLTVSNVAGAETLYLWDGDTKSYALTEGAVYNFTATANATDNNRFVIKKVPYAPVVAGYNVTLNAFGLATFSGDQDAEIPANLNLKAYTATYVAMDKVLNLDEITTGKIKANTGVILFGTAGADYTLPYTTGAAAVGTNHLQPATTASVEDVFVLSGNALYQYTGVVPANKAYLQLPGGAPAPARIGLRFGTATAVESVEAEAVKAEKFIENDQVFIRRGEAVYNMQGQLVK